MGDRAARGEEAAGAHSVCEELVEHGRIDLHLGSRHRGLDGHLAGTATGPPGKTTLATCHTHNTTACANENKTFLRGKGGHWWHGDDAFCNICGRQIIQNPIARKQMRAVWDEAGACGLGKVEWLKASRLEAVGWRSRLSCRVPRATAGA